MVSETGREYPGSWWIPDCDEREIQGILKFDSKGRLHLEASESLNTSESDSTKSDIQHIFGRTDAGEEVTLRECTQTKREVRVEDGSREMSAEYRCESAFVGGHFSDTEVQFENIQVEIPWLTEWMGISGMDISGAMVSDEETNNGVTDDFVLRYNFPSLPPISIDGFSLQFRSRTSFEINWGGRALIDEKTILHVISTNGSRTLTSYLEIIDAFCALLSLGIRKHVRPTRIEGTSNPNSENESRVEVLSSAIILIGDEDPLNRNQIVFQYTDIEPEIEQIFQSWFKKFNDLEPILDLYFSVVHENRTYFRDRIITLLNALEAYHQSLYEENYVTTKDIEKYFANQTEEDVIQFSKQSVADLESKLESVEYPLLKYRLTELIEDTDPVKKVLSDEYETHVDTLISVRNEFAHGSDIESSDTEGTTIQALPELIMEGLLLTEVGISSDQIQDYLRRSYPDFIQ